MSVGYGNSEIISQDITDDNLNQITFDEALEKVGASHRY